MDSKQQISSDTDSESESNDPYIKAERKQKNAPLWKKTLANELLKPSKKRFQRRKVYASDVDQIWASDVLFIKKYEYQNSRNKYILVVIDIFSRYAWAKPMKMKDAICTMNAMKDIFADAHATPQYMWCDEGKCILKIISIMQMF